LTRNSCHCRNQGYPCLFNQDGQLPQERLLAPQAQEPTSKKGKSILKMTWMSVFFRPPAQEGKKKDRGMGRGIGFYSGS